MVLHYQVLFEKCPFGVGSLMTPVLIAHVFCLLPQILQEIGLPIQRMPAQPVLTAECLPGLWKRLVTADKVTLMMS